MEKINSCGILIQCGQRYLLVHATKDWAPILVDDDYWGLPKGQMDDGEDDKKSTAIRETYEETGIDLRTEYHKVMEHAEYETDDRIFTIFKYVDKSQKLMNHIFHCESEFEDNDGTMKPECDRFYWVTRKELEENINKDHKKKLFLSKKKKAKDEVIDV